MRKLLLLVGFCVSSAMLFSQSDSDSLMSIWTNSKLADTIRLQALNTLITSDYLFSQPDSASIFALKMYDYAASSNQKKWMAEALYLQGVSMAIRSDYNNATVKIVRGLHLFEDLQDNDGLARTYNAFGNIFREQAMLKEALSNYTKSAELYEALEDEEGLANIMYNMGLISFIQGNYIQALAYYDRSLMLNEKTGNLNGKANVIGAIGRLHEWQNDLDKAIDYYQKSLDIFMKSGTKIGIATMYTQIGNVYTGKEEYDSAVDYYEKSLRIYEDLNIKSGIASSYYNIGLVCTFNGEYDKALDYTDQSLSLCEEINYRQLHISVLSQFGDIYFNLGDYQEAIRYNLLALNNAKELGMAQQIINSSELLYKSYKALGNYSKALEMHELFKSMNDSILSAEKQRKVIRQEFQSEYNKVALADSLKQAESNQMLELTHKAELKKKNKTRNLLITSGLIALMIAGGLWSRVHYIRKANARLEFEKNRAERSEKFKQQFLANMSHEIRTPMNAVLGMTNLTLDTRLTAKQKNYLEAIKTSSENLLLIINDILDLSKLEAGKMKLESLPFDLHEVLGQVYGTLRFKAEEKGLQFTTEISDDVPGVVIGDPLRLNQVLINLGGNAIKFTEKGSVHIKVEINAGPLNTILFTIRDTGIGIPMNKVNQLFDAFRQADAGITRRYGGTGLGLSISSNLIELQHGKIEVQSEVGKGSVFSIYIPYQEAGESQIAQLNNPVQADEKALRGMRVLLAEDNDYNRIVIHDTLENIVDEVTIDTAENGKIAVDMLMKKDFNLILMDINMPEMNGLDASRIIRETFSEDKKNIPIIALTASVLDEDINRCFKAGMNAYIPKPFSREQLVSTLLNFYRDDSYVDTVTEEVAEPETGNKVSVIPVQKGTLTDLSFLEKFCEGDNVRMKKYISMYTENTPSDVKKIKSALKNGDHNLLKSIIHSMKPHFDFMGMKKTKELVELIELSINGGKITGDIVERVDELIRTCELSIKELSSYTKT